MRRGTTQVLSFSLPVDLTSAKIYVTFSQDGKIIVEKTNGDGLITEDSTVIVNLSQEDTLKFTGNRLCYVQCRYVLSDGTADATNITQVAVADILKDGEI